VTNETSKPGEQPNESAARCCCAGVVRAAADAHVEPAVKPEERGKRGKLKEGRIKRTILASGVGWKVLYIS